jgi:hypothetical protein
MSFLLKNPGVFAERFVLEYLTKQNILLWWHKSVSDARVSACLG